MTTKQYEAVALVLRASLPEDLTTTYKLPAGEARTIHKRALAVLARMSYGLPESAK